MHPADIQKEHARLSQLYRDLHDEELERVAAEAYDLTDIAREALSFEISSRGLKIPLNLTPPSDETLEPLPPEDDGFVPDDRDLAYIYTVHDSDELQKIKLILESGHIECFFGEERTRDPRLFGSKLHGDVEIRVWLAQYNHAFELLTAAVPGFGKTEAPPDVELRCPKCHSDGVIFEERESTSREAKFCWRCDDCGYEWDDDGILEQRPAPEPPLNGG